MYNWILSCILLLICSNVFVFQIGCISITINCPFYHKLDKITKDLKCILICILVQMDKKEFIHVRYRDVLAQETTQMREEMFVGSPQKN